MTTTLDTIRNTALRSIAIMAQGELSDLEDVIAPGAVNREATIEPPACRAGGPAGFHASSVWLRDAFADLAHKVENVVVQGDLVVIATTMSGRHHGPFVLYNADGAIETVWAPTGRSFAVRQSHWLRVTDGLVTEHWANRDDLGQGTQLGWIPPSPIYLLKCAQAKRRAQNAAQAH